MPDHEPSQVKISRPGSKMTFLKFSLPIPQAAAGKHLPVAGWRGGGQESRAKIGGESSLCGVRAAAVATPPQLLSSPPTQSPNCEGDNEGFHFIGEM